MVNPFKKQKSNFGEMIAAALDNCRYDDVYVLALSDKSEPVKMGFTCMLTGFSFCATTMQGAKKELTELRNRYKKAGETKILGQVDINGAYPWLD
jgi:hypothetical protein